MLDVLQAEKGALLGIVAGIGSDRDMLVGVRLIGRVLARRLCRWRRLVRGADGAGCEAQQGCGQHGRNEVANARVWLIAMRVHARLIIIFAECSGKAREFPAVIENVVMGLYSSLLLGVLV